MKRLLSSLRSRLHRASMFGSTQEPGRVFLERILDNLATPVFVKDRDHRFMLVNDALCTLLGRSRADLLGKRDHDFVPAAEADVFVRRDELVFSTRRVDINEEKITDASGVQRTVLTRKAVFQDPDGNDVLVGVISDISERKRMEELLRLNAQVFEHSTEGMFITDGNNDILRVNRAFTHITGYPAEEVVGKNPRILGSGQLPREFYVEMWRQLSERGYWHGEMLNRRRGGELYSEWLTISTVRDQAGRVQHYIALFSDITRRKQAEDHILFLAHHDALTGLPNRALLADRVAQAVARARRGGSSAALLLLDLDHFKEINDQLGHQAGDQLLKEVARVLSGCVRESDTVARLGGDEFVVLLADSDGPRDAQAAAQRILKALKRPQQLQGREAWVGASIGISLFPQDGEGADTLLRSADEAMYRVKRAGRNDFAFATKAARS